MGAQLRAYGGDRATVATGHMSLVLGDMWGTAEGRAEGTGGLTCPLCPANAGHAPNRVSVLVIKQTFMYD